MGGHVVVSEAEKSSGRWPNRITEDGTRSRGRSSTWMTASSFLSQTEVLVTQDPPLTARCLMLEMFDTHPDPI